MTPEQRVACRSIEREVYKLNSEINELRAEQGQLREQRNSTIGLINTNKREIGRLQRELATACIPTPGPLKRLRTDDILDGIGILGCIRKVDRSNRDISGLQAGIRKLEIDLQTLDRELKTLRRRIAGKEALFPILRRQKEQNGCP